MGKNAFDGKTFRELWKWDFSVGISVGRLRPGALVPAPLKIYNMRSGTNETLEQYLKSLYATNRDRKKIWRLLRA
jgi:hypothetical protein